MIHVNGLKKSLGDAEILKGVSFTAPKGQVTGLLGPNGAGKTTTMRVLATLLTPDEGTVEIEGVNLADDPHAVRAVIGLVTEEPGLFERLTPREQLTFVADVHGISANEANKRIDDLAERFGLTDHIEKRCAELSKGNRQKVSLARALVHDPPVLLLDEPTANLDVVAAAALEKLLANPAVIADKTVLLSTHLIEEAERLASHVVGLVEGVVVTEGSQDALRTAMGADSFRDAVIRLLGGAALGGDSLPPR